MVVLGGWRFLTSEVPLDVCSESERADLFDARCRAEGFFIDANSRGSLGSRTQILSLQGYLAHKKPQTPMTLQ